MKCRSLFVQAEEKEIPFPDFEPEAILIFGNCSAQRAQHTIDIIKSRHLALVVDLNMPVLGGHELIRRLRGLSDYFGTPIFVLTTSSMEADKKEAWELRVNGYFLKELAADSYARKIRAMVDFVNGAEWE